MPEQQETIEMSGYRGRFAPSPTGPLHFGSLVAAVASYLDARWHQGEWLVRIEDVDTTRTVAGAADNILSTLEQFGFEWDGAVEWQSRRTEHYQAALAYLRERNAVFSCGCTRRDLRASGRVSEDGEAWYPGTCREGLPEPCNAAGNAPRSVRFRVDDAPICVVDRCQGMVIRRLESSIGDFVVFRSDQLFAYQLAVVVDDGDQRISDVVRGADLLVSTHRQIALQRALGIPVPRYLHVPVAVDPNGYKLSKQTNVAPLDSAKAGEALWLALGFLGQNPPAECKDAGVPVLWQWALAHWIPESIPKTLRVQFPLKPK